MLRLLTLATAFWSAALLAENYPVPENFDGWVYETPDLQILLSPRTPEQLAAFYEARGFPRSMRDRIVQECFITVRIHNRAKQVLWLDLDRWTFTGPDGAVNRHHRNWWKQQWQAAGEPLPSQSTFRWTLLPEELDFRPDEAEGGNITLERTNGSFSLDARFATGRDRDGPDVVVRMENLRCAENPE